MKYLYILILIFSISHFACTQVVDRGVITYGLVTYKVIDGNKVDSNLAMKFVKGFDAMYPDKLLFTPEYIANVHYNDIFKTIELRNVYETSSNKIYTFLEHSNEYRIDSFTNEPISGMPMELDELSRTTVSYSILGFKVDSVCYEITFPDGSVHNASILEAPDLVINHEHPLLGYSKGGFPLKTIITFDNIVFVHGIAQLSTSIKDNDDIFSTSLAGYKPYEHYNNDLQELFQDIDSDTNENFDKGSGTNIDIIKTLISNSIIDTSMGYFKQEYYSWLENDINFDTWAILTVLKEKGNRDLMSTKEDIIRILETHDLLSNEDLIFIKKVARKWPDLHTSQFWNYILYKHIESDFNSYQIRNTIVNNHITLNVDTTTSDEIRNKFIDGTIDYSEYCIATTDLLTPLRTSSVHDIDSIRDIIIEFYGVALNNLVDHTTSQIDTGVLIVTDSFDYFISFHELDIYQYLYSPHDKITYTIKDSVELNESFYRKLLKIAKQIYSDYNTGHILSLYDFRDIVIPRYFANILLETYPDLQIFKHDLCLNRFTEGTYSANEHYPISFPYSEANNNKQFTIKGFRVGDHVSSINYVSTSIKREFLNLIEEYKDDIFPDGRIYKVLEKRINDNLYVSVTQMVLELPGIESRIDLSGQSSHHNILNNSIRNNHDSLNDLKHVFRDIHRITQGEIKATDFQIIGGSMDRISFRYNSKTYEIDNHKVAFMSAMTDLLRTDQMSDKRFYCIDTGLFSSRCFYLSMVLKERLQEALDLVFLRL